jgi:hypothetical protein
MVSSPVHVGHQAPRAAYPAPGPRSTRRGRWSVGCSANQWRVPDAPYSPYTLIRYRRCRPSPTSRQRTLEPCRGRLRALAATLMNQANARQEGNRRTQPDPLHSSPCQHKQQVALKGEKGPNCLRRSRSAQARHENGLPKRLPKCPGRWLQLGASRCTEDHRVRSTANCARRARGGHQEYPEPSTWRRAVPWGIGDARTRTCPARGNARGNSWVRAKVARRTVTPSMPLLAGPLAEGEGFEHSMDVNRP